MKFKECFISSIGVTYEYTSNMGRVRLLEVNLGFFMMKREDNGMIIYQDRVGCYNQTTEDRIVKITDKDLKSKLESQIRQSYDCMIEKSNQKKEPHLIEIDKFIGKKSLYLEQLKDLRSLQDKGGLNDNQLKSYAELRKAIKRVDRRLFSHEEKVADCDAQLKTLEHGKELSIQRMTRFVNTLSKK